jgi:hypothetical protein
MAPRLLEAGAVHHIRLGHGGMSALSPFYPRFRHWSAPPARQLRAKTGREQMQQMTRAVIRSPHRPPRRRTSHRDWPSIADPNTLNSALPVIAAAY